MEPGKKTEPEVKNPQVSVYNFAEIMKEKKAEERAAAPGVEKSDPAKVEKPEKQPETPKKAEEKTQRDGTAEAPGPSPRKQIRTRPQPRSPKPPHRNRKRRSKRSRRKKRLPTVQAAPAPKEPEGPKEAPRRGEEQIVYIKLNELHAFKNHPFEVRGR